jgi:hypothetical protein
MSKAQVGLSESDARERLSEGYRKYSTQLSKLLAPRLYRCAKKYRTNDD